MCIQTCDISVEDNDVKCIVWMYSATYTIHEHVYITWHIK